MTKLFEGLEPNDLRGLVYDVISIDQYTPKIGTDAETVVIAFTVKYEQPAQDLSSFIQSSYVDILDVEASTVPNEEGRYKVFVELERTPNLFKNISDLIGDINHITSTTGAEWKYEAYKTTSHKPFTKENLDNDVIYTPEEYNAKYKKKTDEDIVKERIEFLINY